MLILFYVNIGTNNPQRIIHMTNPSNQDWDLGQTEVQDIAFIFIFGVDVNICQALIPANYVEYQ